MKPGYVYCLRFRSTQFYVGSSTDPQRRFEEHKKSCFSKKPDNAYLARVWKKFGEPTLYIISKVQLDLLLEEEQKFIDLVFGKEGCLNLNPYSKRPPVGMMKGKKHSAETKAKISLANKGKLKGKKHSAEHRQKQSLALKGKVRSAETRARMSKPKSPEHREKISLARKGKERSSGLKAVIGTKGNETIEFPSVKKAAEFIGKNHSAISKALSPKCENKTAGGYRWSYADES